MGGGFKHCFIFTRKLGRWSNLTSIFPMGWNHQLARVISIFTRHFLWVITLLLIGKGPRCKGFQICVFSITPPKTSSSPPPKWWFPTGRVYFQVPCSCSVVYLVRLLFDINPTRTVIGFVPWKLTWFTGSTENTRKLLLEIIPRLWMSGLFTCIWVV